VQNIGSSELKDITVAISPKYPFSKISGETLEKSVSYLNARQDGNDASVLKFKLMTDSNASEGKYNLDITTTAKKAGSSSKAFTTIKTIQIEVRGKEYAQIVTINKANIDIAKEEALEFIITNTGNSPLKNMVVSWKDPKGVILPVYSDNTKYIKYLEPGQSVTVAYSVMADVNAKPGLYTLDVNLSFEDYKSNEKSIQTTAGLFVGGETDFDVSFSESSAGAISLSVANVGNNMAYSVKVSIPDQDGYRVLGSSSTIVGNLEKGDYTIASFNVVSTQGAGRSTGAQPRTAAVNAEKENVTSSSMNSDPLFNVAGAQSAGRSTGAMPRTAAVNADEENVNFDSINFDPLKVQIEYTDAKGERITVDKAVKLETTSGNMTAREARRAGNSSGLSSYLLYIVLIALAGIGVFMYYRQKQSAKKTESNSSNYENGSEIPRH
jgi:hypothetical protein